MTEQAKKARNAYQRKWRKENPEKFQAQRERYWERKAARMQAEAEQQTKTTGTAPEKKFLIHLKRLFYVYHFSKSNLLTGVTFLIHLKRLFYVYHFSKI